MDRLKKTKVSMNMSTGKTSDKKDQDIKHK